jgi:hypothetical protein
MRGIRASLVLGVMALFASTVRAQDPPGPGGQGPGRPPRKPPVLIRALDTNDDGAIDAQEIAAAPVVLRTLDKNGDGKLTADELRPPRPADMPGNPGERGGAGPGGGHPAEGNGPGGGGPRGNREGHGGAPEGAAHPRPPIETALDANHDGVIDAQEISNASASLRTLDKNGDGKLTRDELRPAGAPPERDTRENGNAGPPPDGGGR